ncbi:hypothetical protein PF327_10760 [Sulfurovum sp. XTW-4]|uniref:Uncharacterized protein n=1 Tax=Sulfurovum xiamenensis TaxID=3019066 RepID=A0ABT7QUB7_9BACT|nr:hypothetical protein [Sulfurovum xiamenensis]MDM5264675.1 hypothetical protein [Sulfurovum xiamenensis]
MAAFPSTIACTIVNGFGEELPDTKNYLGGQTFINKSKGKVTAFIKTDADMETFTRWYITDTSYMTLPFTISLPFFGVTRNWNVKFTKKPNIRPSDKASYIRYVDMELEIQDDIDAYIS